MTPVTSREPVCMCLSPLCVLLSVLTSTFILRCSPITLAVDARISTNIQTNPLDCREWLTWLDTTKWLDRTFLRVRFISFQIHNPFLTIFLCFIVLFRLFQSCCSVFTCASVWENTRVWVPHSPKPSRMELALFTLL